MVVVVAVRRVVSPGRPFLTRCNWPEQRAKCAVRAIDDDVGDEGGGGGVVCGVVVDDVGGVGVVGGGVGDGNPFSYPIFPRTYRYRY